MNPTTHSPAELTRPVALGCEGKTVLHEETYSYYKRTMEQSHTLEKNFENSKKGLLSEENSHRNSNLPAPYRWAQSLQDLLEDEIGVGLFQQFLKQEGHDDRPLSFLFACRGVKKGDPNNREKLCKLILVIFEKKVRRISCISPATKAEIQKRLRNNGSLDTSVFDVAQKEVEHYILQTTYPNFLNSELYFRQLGALNVSDSIEGSTPALPTVHEDSELNLSAATFKGLLMNSRKMSSTIKQEASLYIKSPYSVCPSPYSNPHTKYASYLPASAQDSELQSLSSGASGSMDTISQIDNSSADFPMHSRKYMCQLRSKSMKNAVIINYDPSEESSFIPRTQRFIGDPSQCHSVSNPAEFHEQVVEKLTQFLEEQRATNSNDQRLNERLKAIGSYDPLKLNSEGTAKSSIAAPASHQKLLEIFGPCEDNDQDILDQHVSRVFEGPTPTLSPTCASPRSAENAGIMDLPRPNLVSARHSSSNRYKREHETCSNADSGALTDWISEDNLAGSQYQHSSTEELTRATELNKRKDQLRRHATKKQLGSGVTGSFSSFVDSGISVWGPSHPKMTYRLDAKHSTEYEKEHMWKASSTSPVLSRSSSTRKAEYCRNSMGLDSWGVPEPSNVDTTVNLMEARRRLEDDPRIPLKNSKTKYTTGGRTYHDNLRGKVSSRSCDTFEDGISHRKQSKKSSPSRGTIDNCSASNSMVTSVSTNNHEVTTVIGYSYGHGSVPYKSRLPGKRITLRQFKSLLSKKGNFRFFFKRVSDDFGTGVVLEEVSNDSEILPLWEGKVFCVIEAVEDSPNTNEDF